MVQPIGFSNPLGKSFVERNFLHTSTDQVDARQAYNRGNYSVFVSGSPNKIFDPHLSGITGEDKYLDLTLQDFFDLSEFVVSIDYSYDFNTPYAVFDIVFTHSTIVSDYLVPGNWIVVYGPYWNNSDFIPGNIGSVPAEIKQLKQELPLLFELDEYNVADSQSTYEEIDRGQIVSVQKNIGDNNLVKARVKDPAWLLAKNVLPIRLPAGTLTERLRFISREINIPLYEPLIETSHELPSTRGGRESVWEDINFDLGMTNRVEGTRYVLRHRKGSFFLQEITTQKRMWSFEVGSNLISLELRQSIDEYYNKIYVLTNTDVILSEFFGNADDPTSLEIDFTGFAKADDSDFERFGEHVLVVKEDLTEKTPTAQLQAIELLKKFNKIQQDASLASFSLNGLRWGDQILVYEPVANLSGVFWIRSGHHTIKAGSAIMTLQLDFDRLAPDDVRKQQSETSVLEGIIPGAGSIDLSGAE